MIKTTEFSVIPQLKRFSEISLNRGDTLVLYWDFDKYDMQSAETFLKIIQDAFPFNQVLMIPKETKVEVIKER